ncbi:MAG TPA: tail fiber protein [Actinomycetota bacterium]
MADPFVAEIRIFGFSFAPKGWATCDGQILPISQNTALFALIGTFYGGNGKTTFALPNLQGNAPMHQTDDFPLGATGGTETVTLLNSEIAFHNHTANASAFPANQLAPDPTEVLATSQDGFAYQTNTSQDLVQMDPNALSITGSDLPHNNMQPYLTLLFCIALQGVFPPRG